MSKWMLVAAVTAMVAGGAAGAVAAQEPYPGHDLVIDYVKILGPAPWPPSVGGGRGRASCTLPDVKHHPRCRAWEKEYAAYQVRLRALLAEEAAKRGG